MAASHKDEDENEDEEDLCHIVYRILGAMMGSADRDIMETWPHIPMMMRSDYEPFIRSRLFSHSRLASPLKDVYVICRGPSMVYAAERR